jgi:riboflavin biosynthesis pyrimidine reductase
VFINMVATIDGKTVTGDANEPVADLGSETDHATMRGLENVADAVLIGAGNLRATPKIWYPNELKRIVATKSGNLNYSSRFFTDAPDKVFIICPREVDIPKPYVKLSGDFQTAFRALRVEHNVTKLLVEGGSHLNGEILRRGLADELFLTLAPKIKLGENLPTYAGGEPLPRDEVQSYELLSTQQVGQELFLRYRRQLKR